MKPINEFKLEILSKSANESFARVAVAAFVSQLDPTLDEIAEIKTVVSEVVTNSVVHGYKEGIGKIFISAKIFADGLVYITIRDKGCGIDDLAQAMEPMFTSSQSADRAGMGFTIMQAFTDKLKVSSNKSGTKVIIRKRLQLKEEQSSLAQGA